jgi:hypothetical protein
VVIDPDRKTYTRDGVKCGSSYQLVLTAVNSVGNGKPSSVITATTKGGGMHTSLVLVFQNFCKKTEKFSHVTFYVY